MSVAVGLYDIVWIYLATDAELWSEAWVGARGLPVPICGGASGSLYG
jgi:hypothetical protein